MYIASFRDESYKYIHLKYKSSLILKVIDFIGPFYLTGDVLQKSNLKYQRFVRNLVPVHN
jgi:hypothetical protein